MTSFVGAHGLNVFVAAIIIVAHIVVASVVIATVECELIPHVTPPKP